MWRKISGQSPFIDLEILFVPIICLYEVFKRVLHEFGEPRGLDATGLLSFGLIIDLDRQIAIHAAQIFTTNSGTPISPRNMLRHFKNKQTSIGLPNIRFHDLKHTTASLLLEKNVDPKIVSELSGHSTVTLTLKTYLHIINPMSGVAADAMAEIVGP